jgi:hypothetical protein
MRHAGGAVVDRSQDLAAERIGGRFQEVMAGRGPVSSMSVVAVMRRVPSAVTHDLSLAVQLANLDDVLPWAAISTPTRFSSASMISSLVIVSSGLFLSGYWTP